MTEPTDPDPAENFSSQGLIFTNFVREVAQAIVGPSKILSRQPSDMADPSDLEVDLLMRDAHGARWLIAVRVDDPSTRRRLLAVATSLVGAAKANRGPVQPHLVLAIPGQLSAERAGLLAGAGITLWDGPRLTQAAHAAGVRIPPGLGISSRAKRPDSRGRHLRRQLEEIPPGQQTWVAFQDWATEVFEYLFCPPLEAPIPEYPTENGHNRRDIVMANYAEHGFWRFMRHHYRADYIVIDAKNHSGQLPKVEVLKLANYLSAHGTGLFGMLACRHGLDNGARWTVREHWVLHDKLIVTLSVNDLLQMLEAKDADSDPSAVIKQRIEDFRLGL